jgi:predicted nucleotidyltransferase
MKDRGSIVRKLERKELLPPWKPFVKETCYEVIMGSFAYGVSNMGSDVDVYGVFVPPIDMVFPHASGYIQGFGPQPNVINVEQKHHIVDKDTGKEYDFALYNLVNYFKLCAENNPNMVDSLFVPERCVVHSDEVGDIMRENRRLFLCREIQKKLSGYAYSQLRKLRTKEPVGKRKDTIAKYGYDVKFAYHVVRLVQQAEMVLSTGDLDLEANRELLKEVRAGEWSLEKLETWFEKRQSDLDTLYINSPLPLLPRYDKLKPLLMNCLEARYGSLSAYFNLEGSEQIATEKLRKIKEIINE